VAVANARSVNIYAVNTLKMMSSLTGHQDLVTALTWSGDDTTLTSVDIGGSVYVWDAASGKQLRVFSTENLSYSSVALGPTGGGFAVTGTLLLHCLYTDVIMMLHYCYTVDTRLTHCC
jgi:WD40 repeat protein